MKKLKEEESALKRSAHFCLESGDVLASPVLVMLAGREPFRGNLCDCRDDQR